MIPVPLTEGVSGYEPQAERDAAPARVARNHAPGASGHCPPPLGEAALKARRGRASEGKPRKQGSRMMPVHKRKTVRGTERRGGAPRGGRPASWDVRARARALRADVIRPL